MAKKNTKHADTQQQMSDMAKPKKKKKNQMLASVVSESVVEKVLEIFAENKNFITTYKGEEAYIGILLDVNDIGGMSRKTNKDESKGSIVEHIKSGRIATLITAPLLADECMVIIPNAVTVDVMSEFDILVNAPYKACYVMKNGDVIVTNKDVKFASIMSVFQYDLKAEDVIFNESSQSLQNIEYLDDSNDNYDVEEVEEEVEDDETVPDDVLDDVDASDDEYQDDNISSMDSLAGEPDNEVVGEVIDEDADESIDETVDEPIDDNDTLMSEEESVDDDDAFINEEEPFVEDFSDEDYDNVDDEYDEELEEQMRETVVRKFYADDLGLEVSTEPFDVQFMHNNDFIPFNENRGEGWLNSYLNEMSINANAELRKLHSDNLFKARELYFNLISLHCEDIQKQLDTQDSNTKYGQLLLAIKAARQSENQKINETVAKKKQELESRWEEKLEQVREDAARMAEQQYRERYGEAHDTEIFNLDATITQRIDDGYNDAVRNLNQDRKSEASKRLDYGINASLAEVAKEYAKMLQSEQIQYKRLQKSMLDFIDENRKDDIARTKVMQNEIESSDKVEKVMAETTARIKSIEAEYEQKKANVQAEISKMEKIHDEQISKITDNYETRMQEIRDENKRLQDCLDQLTDKYNELDDKKNKEYESRIKGLEMEKATWESKCDNIIAVNKRSNTTMMFIAIIASIAFAAIGVLVGFLLSSSSNVQQPAQSVQPTTVQSYNSVPPTTTVQSYSSVPPTTAAAQAIMPTKQTETKKLASQSTVKTTTDSGV